MRWKGKIRAPRLDRAQLAEPGRIRGIEKNCRPGHSRRDLLSGSIHFALMPSSNRANPVALPRG
jgi:hypothetical protein